MHQLLVYSDSPSWGTVPAIRNSDAGGVTPTSAIDGIHLDAAQHAILGTAIAAAVADLLPGLKCA